MVWCLVALGLTCVAARTTRRTGAPMEKAMLLLETCVSGEVNERRSEDGAFSVERRVPTPARFFPGGSAMIYMVDLNHD